jgi:hypothetical protein
VQMGKLMTNTYISSFGSGNCLPHKASCCAPCQPQLDVAEPTLELPHLTQKLAPQSHPTSSSNIYVFLRAIESNQ